MPRLNRDEDVPRSLPWLNSYADMVTLLWTFFILLFAVSVLNAKKFESVVGSLQQAFGILDRSSTIGIEPGSASEMQLNAIARELARLEAHGQEFQEELERSGLADKVSLEMDDRGLIFRFKDSALFDLGSADIRSDARPVLLKVAKLIRTVDYQVRIEGHTDDWPISTERFPSNWELSTGRAASVVRFFIENAGFGPDKLEAAGYGEYRPIETNATPEGRQRNRRVDVVLLRPSLGDLEPKAGPPGLPEAAPR